MTVDLLGVATSLVDRGRSGEALEAFVMHERDLTVKVYEGEVESLSSAEPRGAGVRLLSDGRAGFAYTTDLSEERLEDLVERARANAAQASRDEALALAPRWDETPSPVDGLWSSEFEDSSPDDKVAFATDLEHATKSHDPRIRTVEDALYSDSVAEVALVTTEGVAGSYRVSEAWCYSVAIATEGDDTQVGFEFDLGRSLADLHAADTGRRAAQRAVAALGAKPIASARMPVVLEPYTAAQFLGVLAQALTGEAVQKGRSLFAGKLGETVAGNEVTLWDDGRVPSAPGSSPWDAEGVPTGRTEVVSEGVLRSFLYDVTSARREGRSSTGNAARAGFRSAPGPAPTNLSFEPTGQTRTELLKAAGSALLVRDFHGVHSGANPISGDFSVGITGALLEEGQIAAPVKEVTIAAPILEILSRIQAVADDRRWLPFGGSLGGATTLVAEMTVAGA